MLHPKISQRILMKVCIYFYQDKHTTYYEENDSKNISRRINPNLEKHKEEVIDSQNTKLLNKTIENLRIALSEKNNEITILKRVNSV